MFEAQSVSVLLWITNLDGTVYVVKKMNRKEEEK